MSWTDLICASVFLSGSSGSQKTDRATVPWSSSFSPSGSSEVGQSDSKFHVPTFPFFFSDTTTDVEMVEAEKTIEHPRNNNNSPVITRRKSRKTSSDESESFDTWVNSIFKWQGEQQINIAQEQQQPRRKARNAKKRARASDDELPLPKRAAIMDSDDKEFAQVLWSQFVALSGGRMSFVRRHKEKPRSWKDLLEPVTILGDFRSQTALSSPDNEKVQVENAEGIWQAILALCEALGMQLKQPSEQNPIFLSQVIRLLEYCNRLPDPENVFVVHPHDTTIKDIHDGLDALVGYVETARVHQASVVDMWHRSGVDVEELRKRVDMSIKESPLQLDEVRELQCQIDAVTDWQTRLDAGVENLEEAEALVRQGERLGFESRGLAQLRSRLSKVYEIRETIRAWRSSGKKETIKFISSLVRDIQRVKCPFEEAQEILSIQQEADSWTDRASIAIRTKLSLQEMDDLVKRGEKLPLDLSDYVDKLATRIALGKSWLQRFEEVVPRPENSPSQTPSVFMLMWMQNIRSALNSSTDDGDAVIPTLHELASEGGRLPVQVDCVQLLQIELEARTWSAKTKKWESRRPKLEELREHVSKSTNLRERLVILDKNERECWQLEGEKDVRLLVDQVETWLEKYDSLSERTWSLVNLRELSEAAEKIAANLGTAVSQLNKILNQAEEWYAQNATLIRCCQNGENVDISDLRAAVKSADDLVVELEEASQLQMILNQVSEWTNKTSMVTGVKRRGKKCSFGIDDLEELIRQAGTLPVNTDNEVKTLLQEIEIVRGWQKDASRSLESIALRFDGFRQGLLTKYGSPEHFDRKKIVNDSDMAESEQAGKERDSADLQTLIEDFNKEAGGMVVSTPESIIAPILEAVGRWSSRSQKYLDSQRDIFDKRFFGAFDRFIAEGKSFCNSSQNDGDTISVPFNAQALGRVRSAFAAVVHDQLERLSAIAKDREDFIKWSRTAEAVISPGERKPTLEKLKEVSLRGKEFPSGCELVEKLRNLEDEALEWTENISRILASGEKITMAEARSLCDEAEKIGFVSPELKKLQSEIKAARAWANQVKRSKLNQGSVQVRTVQTLIDEHDSLMISMPEELSKLSHAVKNYCICRRPYDGFMIGCDDCGEWFHVGCIGVTESKANKVDKYTCVRCSALQSYKTCAGTLASTIKKWTSRKELKRARQVLAQKHQRKVRKETKQIETIEIEKKELLEKLGKLATGVDAESNKMQEPIETMNSPVNDIMIPEFTQSLIAKPDTAMKTDDTPAEGNGIRSETSTSENFVAEKEKVECRLKAIEEELVSCQCRLAKLAEDLSAQKNLYRKEDESAKLFEKWSIRLRSLVLAPATEESALASRPGQNGDMSVALENVSAEASRLGLNSFDEVISTHDALARMEWAFRALRILSRRPTIEEMVSLINHGKNLKVLDDKALRVMRFIRKTRERAETWQEKVAKALAPLPGETRNYDVNTLRELLRAADDIPLHLPFESRLSTVIEDKGVRHCICGGPSDGRFMLCCDHCAKWYHGQCLNITKDSLDEEAEWKCPVCMGAEIDKSTLDLNGFHEKFEMDTELENHAEDQDDVSSKAPNINELWPPFGLLGSEKAKEALGDACCSIPDSVGYAKVEAASSTSQVICQVIRNDHRLPASEGDAVPVPGVTVSHEAPLTTTLHNVSANLSVPNDGNWLREILGSHRPVPLTSTHVPHVGTTASFGSIEQLAAALRLQQGVPSLNGNLPGGVSNHYFGMFRDPCLLESNPGNLSYNQMMVNQPVVAATGSVDSTNLVEQRLALLASRDPIELARQHEILVNALADAGRNP